MNTDNQWATFLFSFQVIHNIFDSISCSFKMSTLSTLDVTTSLASFKMFKMSTLSTFDVSYRRLFKMSFGFFLGRRAHLFQRMFMIDVLSSRHILRRRLVSTLWTHPHVMSIDRSQSHHRKQMWCQMLINL